MYFTSCPGSLTSSLRLVDSENRRVDKVERAGCGNIRMEDRGARCTCRKARNMDLLVNEAILSVYTAIRLDSEILRIVPGTL